MMIIIISVYRNLTSCEPISTFLQFHVNHKTTKTQKPSLLGQQQQKNFQLLQWQQGDKVYIEADRYFTASPVLQKTGRSFKRCQFLFWFFCLIHAILHEIPDCMFLSFHICSFALTSKNLSDCGFSTTCSPIIRMVSGKNFSHFILVKLTKLNKWYANNVTLMIYNKFSAFLFAKLSFKLYSMTV